MIGIQLIPMTTMLCVRTSHYCKSYHTHFEQGSYTESDIVHVRKRVCPCETIKNHLYGANVGKEYILAIYAYACMWQSYSTVTSKPPVRVHS